MFAELGAAESNAMMGPVFGHAYLWTCLADLRAKSGNKYG